MCPGRVSAGEEAHRLHLAWIRRIEDRDSVAEHVAHIQMLTVEHDLNAVRPSTDIAVGEMSEAFSGAFRRNRSFLRARLPGGRGQCCESNQTLSAIAPAHRAHILLLFLMLSSSTLLYHVN